MVVGGDDCCESLPGLHEPCATQDQFTDSGDQWAAGCRQMHCHHHVGDGERRCCEGGCCTDGVVVGHGWYEHGEADSWRTVVHAVGDVIHLAQQVGFLLMQMTPKIHTGQASLKEHATMC